MTLALMAPGVYIQEQPAPRTVVSVGTSTAAFLGTAPDANAHLNEAWPVDNWSEFRKHFASSDNAPSTMLANAVYGFFNNRGSRCYVLNIPKGEPISGRDRPRSGLKLLEENDEVAIVAAPGSFDPDSHEALLTHCEKMGDRVCICDTPPDVQNTDLLKTVETAPLPKGKDKDKGAAGGAGAEEGSTKPPSSSASAGGLHPRLSELGFGAFYFPWIWVRDAINPRGDLVAVAPSGHIAGVWSRTDALRGVHKAPANEPIAGALNLTYRVTAEEQAELNSKGVNCVRFFSDVGIRVWGARTLADETTAFKYIPVRRLFNFVEKSILRSNSWVVFEPNDETLWKTIRAEISGFLRMVHRDGALVGKTPEEAFFVKCDAETNPPESVDMGYVVTVVGLAPVKPAEFVVFKIGFHQQGAKVENV